MGVNHMLTCSKAESEQRNITLYSFSQDKKELAVSDSRNLDPVPFGVNPRKGELK